MIYPCFFLILILFQATDCACTLNKQCTGVNQFRCINGQCIKKDLICDNKNDCTDGSDENFALCLHNKLSKASSTTAESSITSTEGTPTTIGLTSDPIVISTTTAAPILTSNATAAPVNASSTTTAVPVVVSSTTAAPIDISTATDADVDATTIVPATNTSLSDDDLVNENDTTSNNRVKRSRASVPISLSQISSRFGCDVNEFACLSGECISRTLTCDGHRDCSDGSDESQSICPNYGGITLSYNHNNAYPSIQPETPISSNYGGNTVSNTNYGNNNGIYNSNNNAYKPIDEYSRNPQTNTPSGYYENNNGNNYGSSINNPTNNYNYNNNYNNNNNNNPSGTYNNANSNLNSNSNKNNYNNIGTTTNTINNNKNNYINNTSSGKNSNSNNNNYVKTGISKLTPCSVPAQPNHGRWRLHRSLCESGRECDAPGQLRSMDPGTYLVYNCEEGYTLNGNRDVLCGPGGRWIKEPTCEEIKCRYLSDSATEAICILNQVVVSCEIPSSINTRATLKCRDGFVEEVAFNSGHKNVTCQSDGNWSPEPIKCVRKPKKVTLILKGDMIMED